MDGKRNKITCFPPVIAGWDRFNGIANAETSENNIAPCQTNQQCIRQLIKSINGLNKAVKNLRKQEEDNLRALANLQTAVNSNTRKLQI
jgi:TolA-binding protein